MAKRIFDENLTDVKGFVFDYSVPVELRLDRILETVKTPYCFRVGETGVELEFSNRALSLSETLERLIHKAGE